MATIAHKPKAKRHIHRGPTDRLSTRREQGHTTTCLSRHTHTRPPAKSHTHDKQTTHTSKHTRTPTKGHTQETQQTRPAEPPKGTNTTQRPRTPSQPTKEPHVQQTQETYNTHKRPIPKKNSATPPEEREKKNISGKREKEREGRVKSDKGRHVSNDTEFHPPLNTTHTKTTALLPPPLSLARSLSLCRIHYSAQYNAVTSRDAIKKKSEREGGDRNNNVTTYVFPSPSLPPLCLLFERLKRASVCNPTAEITSTHAVTMKTDEDRGEKNGYFPSVSSLSFPFDVRSFEYVCVETVW